MKIRNTNHPLGTVKEALPNTRFKISMDSGDEIVAYLSGKMKIRKISILPGDRVEVILDPAGGKDTNRIIWRHT